MHQHITICYTHYNRVINEIEEFAFQFSCHSHSNHTFDLQTHYLLTDAAIYLHVSSLHLFMCNICIQLVRYLTMPIEFMQLPKYLQTYPPWTNVCNIQINSWLEPRFPCKCMFLYNLAALLKLCKYTFYDLTIPNTHIFSMHVCIFWPFGE